MSDAAAAFYRDVFQKVYDAPEWQEYMKKKSLRGEFLTGAALKEYWTKERDIHKGMLENIGEI